MMINALALMKYSGLKIDTLESAHALKVLIALKREGPTARSLLYSMISSSNRTVFDRVEMLIEKGLVEDGPIDKPPYRALSLTQKGKEIADHAEKIEQILNR